ncbi:MAG TPA: EamA family transporter [Oceanospirillaceae bacterium]|nr:EamA family transporter [Oceanospirillaceae bacterium]
MYRPGMKAYSLLILQGAVWGSSFQAIKYALEDFGPMTIAAGRIVLAAVILMIYAWSRGNSLPKHLPSIALLFVISLFNCALPFFLIPWGEQDVASGRAAIFMASGPLITLVLAHFFTTDERINGRKALAFVLGFIGVLLVIGVGAFNSGIGALLPQLALIMAATSYAISGLLVKRVTGISNTMMSACVLLAGSLITLPAALIWETPVSTLAAASWSALLALIYLGLFPTGLMFLVRFYLINNYGYIFVSQVGYLVPLFSVLFGTLLLGEQLSLSIFLGLGLILSGIFISRTKA